ncbi:flavin reductase family protein [Amycolatopsis thermoflava]|uniref:flavin reductase family protein n=1 Tax=Amycolatopsis thermoflava TaxID=84480 RepID=UPI003EB9A35B
MIDGTTLRAAFGQFPSGVAAVCALVGGEPVGMAASTFTAVSLDPPLVSVCVRKASRTWRTLRAAPELGVSVLSAGQGGICRSLAMPDGDRFAGVPWVARGSAVLIEDSALQLECRLTGEVDAGDHVIALLGITALRDFPGAEPVVFHRSTFRVLR